MRVDFSGQVTDRELRSLPEDVDSKVVLREIKSLVASLNRRASGPLIGIGLGAPGVVDPKRVWGVYYAFIEDWKEVAVGAELSRRFKVAVHSKTTFEPLRLLSVGLAKQRTLRII